jgi:organic radical activating enzyme
MKEYTYPLMEHFYTIQGEGFHSGKAAYFLRLGGCDVGCVWCDVKDSWEANKHPSVSMEQMLTWILESGAPNVVVTGGEPLMHNLDPLCELLKANGLNLWLETSASHPLSGIWDWICVSPKKFKQPLKEILQVADELKVVVYHSSDLEWAESHTTWLKPNCRLYLQPEWDKKDRVTPLIIRRIQEHPSWRLSLQTHKYLNIP